MYWKAVLRARSDWTHGTGCSSLQRGPALRGHERGVPTHHANLRGSTCLPESGEGSQEPL